MNGIDVVTQIDYIIGGGIVNSRGEIIRGFTIGFISKTAVFKPAVFLTHFFYNSLFFLMLIFPF